MAEQHGDRAAAGTRPDRRSGSSRDPARNRSGTIRGRRAWKRCRSGCGSWWTARSWPNHARAARPRDGRSAGLLLPTR